MTQHDEMDITAYLQTEGRRLAGRGPRAGLPAAITSSARALTAGGGQLQQGSHQPAPVAPAGATYGDHGDFVPYSLSEALYRMELEKRQRGFAA